MAYTLETINKYDFYANRSMDALLAKEGISRDKCLEYSCGIFDDGELIATGSYFGNSIRCLAVSREHQGEGLINQLLSHLLQLLFELGRTHLFIYTKLENAKFFTGLGFCPVAEAGGKLVLLENRAGGLDSYCASLAPGYGSSQAAIVMNANPFTLGHRHLVEKAAAANDCVHIFVLSEDRSLFPAHVRMELVKKGLADIKNLIFHETGPYIISSATFPSYFLREEDAVVEAQAMLDAVVFSKIAQKLGINRRYLGEEAPGSVTDSYNRVLSRELPNHGIECSIIPRLRLDGRAVSASDVRQAIHDGKTEDIRPLLPESTWQYLCSPSAEDIIKKIMEQEYVRHD